MRHLADSYRIPLLNKLLIVAAITSNCFKQNCTDPEKDKELENNLANQESEDDISVLENFIDTRVTKQQQQQQQHKQQQQQKQQQKQQQESRISNKSFEVNPNVFYERIIENMTSEISFLKNQLQSKENYFLEEINFLRNQITTTNS